MAWLSTLWKILKVAPSLIPALFKLYMEIRGMWELRKMAKREGWIEKGRALVAQIKETKDATEREKLLDTFIDLTSKPPS